MKILISSDGTHAHFFQRLAWLNAFRSCGIDAQLWDCKKISAFDIFDKFEPDIFLGQSYNLDEALVKCIYERPHLKVGLRAGDWGDHESEIDKTKFNILFASEKEKKLLKKLKDETGKPDFVHIHYLQDDVDKTHAHYKTIGIEPKSLIMCADINVYGGSSFDPKFECDIGFVGGYWPHKGTVINNYLFPMLGDINKYKIKIFGNQPWPVNQYCGMIQDKDVKNLFRSAKVCPNLSEPHAHVFGVDINERIFKILYSGGFCVSDYCEAYNLFGDGIILTKTAEEFREKIDYYINHPEEAKQIANKGRKVVIESHTNFHRIASIFEYFGMTKVSDEILKNIKTIDHKLRR
jgi:hypothetical protein